MVGELKVIWIPQVPMKAFEVKVDSVLQAKFLLNALTEYDLFQFENKVKPDYSNMGGLLVWEIGDKGVGEWVDWMPDALMEKAAQKLWPNVDFESIDSLDIEQLRQVVTLAEEMK